MQLVATRLETLAELHWGQRARALRLRPSRGSTPRKQTLGPLPRDVNVAGDQRIARHRGRSHARRAVRLRVRRERQEPPQAR